jgi:hypothetical protein
VIRATPQNLGSFDAQIEVWTFLQDVVDVSDE